jgi:hypothetical protein
MIIAAHRQKGFKSSFSHFRQLTRSLVYQRVGTRLAEKGNGY